MKMRHAEVTGLPGGRFAVVRLGVTDVLVPLSQACPTPAAGDVLTLLQEGRRIIAVGMRDLAKSVLLVGKTTVTAAFAAGSGTSAFSIGVPAGAEPGDLLLWVEHPEAKYSPAPGFTSTYLSADPSFSYNNNAQFAYRWMVAGDSSFACPIQGSSGNGEWDRIVTLFAFRNVHPTIGYQGVAGHPFATASNLSGVTVSPAMVGSAMGSGAWNPGMTISSSPAGTVAGSELGLVGVNADPGSYALGWVAQHDVGAGPSTWSCALSLRPGWETLFSVNSLNNAHLSVVGKPEVGSAGTDTWRADVTKGGSPRAIFGPIETIILRPAE